MSGLGYTKALLVSLLTTSGALASSSALAEVRHLGDWDKDPSVTLDLDRTPRDEAVKRLAAAVGWSLVSTVPPGEPIDIHVRDTPVGKVLDLLLTDGDYIVKRDGKLIAVSRVAPGAALPPLRGPAGIPPVPPIPPVPAIPPVPPIPPMPPTDDEADPAEEAAEERGPEPAAKVRDREVFGGNLRIEKDEVVHDVSVFGGNLEVLGTVTGDLVVMGGNARVHEGAHVHGDVTAMGGTVAIEDHARVDGDVATLGGVLRRGKDAEIGGEVQANQRDHHGRPPSAAAPEPKASLLRRASRQAGNAVTAAALLFVLGVVLLSLATTRMETLKVEIASRPMRTFAAGVVALLGGVGLIIALTITVVGIPLALIVLMAAVAAAFAGLSATLETIGGALLGHKTKNPYVHLAFGCLLFLVLGAIPFVGEIVKLAVLLTGFGSVAATRGAGFFPAKNKGSGSPYRDGAPAA